ncbi:phosphatidylinositol-binding clathrin assembly protein-like isoform X1 [Mustela putorius furo]|uniref:Phosphatidylinositol-binding clathrin assembly protein-like n=1 Tax=Mustela putorius furo TaxID=9669 RepID=M3YXG6_MUSPF|nr:phosphatidylinositol-binding clathrin assembly protein-like isoform X1 [Mustela putorius furo]
MGSSASKAALGATTDEPMEPKAKHLADLIQYINGTNMSVDHLADVLSEKTGNSSWVVVFKALVTVHHLMVHGNERFIQHLASRNSLFTLHNFLDKSVIEGYTMSTFIRRYSRYLNEKSLAYRLIASDITKTKRGTDGTMRTMDTKRLLNTLPVIQTQFDALLNFNANPDELTNGIIHAAFMLLFKDSLRLFAAYNEGILNLLDKYFDMRKNQCKESLDIYIKFLERTAKLAQFLKVAEQVGIDQNDIPYLTQAPHSLLEALKQHLASLEEKNDSWSPYSLQHALIPSIPNNPVVNASASGAWFAAHKSVEARQQHGKITAKNLDGSLVNLVGNLNLGESPVNRLDMEWPQPSEMEIAGGMKWQLNTYTCTSTLWKHISIPPVPHMVLPPVGYPVTSQQVPMYRMVHTPKGALFLMAPQPMIHGQPGSRTSNSAPSTRNNTQSM